MTNENVDVPLESGSKVDDLMAETEEQSNKNSDKALRGRAVQIVEIDKDEVIERCYGDFNYYVLQ